MAVMTVTGEMDAGLLGLTLAHEHLLIDLRNQFTEFADPEKKRISHEPVNHAHAAILRRDPYAVRDNLVLNDEALVAREVSAFASQGGRTVVECTVRGIGQDAPGLRRIARATCLNIIAGCGYYTWDTHQASMNQRCVEDIAAEMLADLQSGIAGSDVRAGIIGELGTSDPIHPQEITILKAAARAFQKHPVPIYVHTYPWGMQGLAAAEILRRDGVDPEKIVICHADVVLNGEYIDALLAAGVWVEFDNFGKEFTLDYADGGFGAGRFATDVERIAALTCLRKRGFGGQLLISNDICLKSMLRSFGGTGYGHIIDHVVPAMCQSDSQPGDVVALMNANMRRLFS